MTYYNGEKIVPEKGVCVLDELMERGCSIKRVREIRDWGERIECCCEEMKKREGMCVNVYDYGRGERVGVEMLMVKELKFNERGEEVSETDWEEIRWCPWCGERLGERNESENRI